ncbi:MAG: COG3014 family protein [Oligoflexales bacterium]
MNTEICKRPRTIDRIVLLATIGMFTVTCASYTDETKEIRYAYRAESYDSALSKIEESDIKEQDRNRLLYLLEKSMVLDRMGKREASRKELLNADKTAEKLYRTSLAGDVASFLYNDSTTDYAGEDYEKVAIHTMLALSFLDDNQLSNATVEARRINTLLNEINSFYEENKNRYAEDAFARYLAAMIYEQKNETDNAIVDYKAALALYETSYSRNFATPVPDQLVQSLYDLLLKRGRTAEAKKLAERFDDSIKKTQSSDFGELVVIHEVDTISVKTNEEFVLPISNQVVRFSFPVIRSKSKSYYGRTGIADGEKFHSGELVQFMDEIASGTLQDKRLRMMAKQGARLLLKGQITRQANENFGVLGWLAGNIYGAVTETADTRGWTLLPSAFYVTRERLKPGNHSLKIYTNGKLSQVRSYKVEKDKITFVRDFG